MKKPFWDLAEVKRLSIRPGGLWVQIGRAVRFFGRDAQAAQAAALGAIQALTTRDFVETQQLTWDRADVYGLTVADGSGWYLKLYIDQATQVTVISFHPLECRIKTNGGWVDP